MSKHLVRDLETCSDNSVMAGRSRKRFTAIQALQEHDKVLAQQVIEGDNKSMNWKTRSGGMPEVAGPCTSPWPSTCADRPVFMITTDLERMGDLARTSRNALAIAGDQR